MVAVESFQLRMATVGCYKLNSASWKMLLLGGWQMNMPWHLAHVVENSEVKVKSQAVLRCHYPKSSSQGMFFLRVFMIVFQRMFFVSCHCFILYSISNCHLYCNCQVLMRPCPLLCVCDFCFPWYVILFSISNCQHYCNCQVLMKPCPLCVCDFCFLWYVILFRISNCQHYCNCQVLMRPCPLCVWFLFPVICHPF